MIILIWAEDNNHGIGIDNKLPWKIKEEMQHFRKTTINKILVMGRKTFESIGKPLPNRTNYILTRNNKLVVEGAYVICDIQKILDIAKNNDVYIIGGKEIYDLFFKYADKLIISKIKKAYQCNTYMDFTNLINSQFTLSNIEKYDEFNVEYYIKK